MCMTIQETYHGLCLHHTRLRVLCPTDNRQLNHGRSLPMVMEVQVSEGAEGTRTRIEAPTEVVARGKDNVVASHLTKTSPQLRHHSLRFHDGDRRLDAIFFHFSLCSSRTSTTITCDALCMYAELSSIGALLCP